VVEFGVCGVYGLVCSCRWKFKWGSCIVSVGLCLLCRLILRMLLGVRLKLRRLFRFSLVKMFLVYLSLHLSEECAVIVTILLLLMAAGWWATCSG